MDKSQLFGGSLPKPAAFSREFWEKKARAQMEEAGVDWPEQANPEGIRPLLLYTEEQWSGQSGFPGGGDRRRGGTAAGAWAAPRRISQGADAVLPEDANRQLRDHILHGGNGTSLDLTGGLYLETLQDMLALFDKVCPRTNPLNVYAGATPVPFLSLLKLRSLHLGYDSKTYLGCAGGDPLGEYALRGKLPADLDCYLDQFAATMRWAVLNIPGVKCIFVRGGVYHNGGASAGQELACVLAAAVEYIDGLLQRGHHIDDIARQIRLEFCLGGDLFLDAAKLRAARMLWAGLIDAYGGGEQAQKADISGADSYFYQSVGQPLTNISRSTIAALAAWLGAADQLCSTPYDRVDAPCSDQARRLALDNQLLLQQQFELCQPMDPAGGSYYLESLTRQVAEQAWRYLCKLEQAGGMLEALQDGMVQEDVAATLQARLAARPAGAARDGGEALPGQAAAGQSGAAIREARAKAMAQHNQTVDPQVVAQNLANVDGCVCTAMAALSAGATVTQVTRALNRGHLQPIPAIKPHRFASLC